MVGGEDTEKTLQGWKEIASYLERDVRTAVRWEKEAGLPVRRYPTGKRASVYALVSEIDAWKEQDQTEASVAPPPLWRRPVFWAAAAVAAAAALVITYGPILNPRDPVAEAAEGSMRSEQVWTDYVFAGNLSRNGKWMTYSKDGDLWLRNVATGESRRLSDKKPLHGVESSAISPDGSRVAAAWYNHDIYKYELRVGAIPPAGETDNGTPAFQPPPDERGWVGVVGWLSDSKVAFRHDFRESRLGVADLEKGSWTLLKSFEWNGPDSPVVSPDGRWIAYGFLPEPVARQHDIYLLSTDGSAETLIVEHPADDIPVAFTPDGSHLLFRSSRTGDQSLWAVRLSDGKVVGAPRLVSAEYASIGTVGVSPQGDLYHVKRVGFFDVYEARVAFETGRVLQEPKPLPASVLGNNRDPAYSPDGTRIAYIANRSIGGHGGYRQSVIVVRELNSGQEQLIEPALQAPQQLVWSADSSTLLFRANDGKGKHAAYQVRLEDGKVDLVFSGPPGISNMGWMPGGRSLHFKDRRGFGGTHTIVDLETGEERELLPKTDSARLQLSPDGSRFAVYDVRKQETVLFTVDVEDGRRRELHRWPRLEGYSWPSPMAVSWSHDSTSIAFWKMASTSTQASLNGELWTIPADGGEARKTELYAPALTKAPWALALHPDGERVAFSAGDPKFEIWKLSNFLGRLGGE